MTHPHVSGTTKRKSHGRARFSIWKRIVRFRAECADGVVHQISAAICGGARGSVRGVAVLVGVDQCVPSQCVSRRRRRSTKRTNRPRTNITCPISANKGIISSPMSANKRIITFSMVQTFRDPMWGRHTVDELCRTAARRICVFSDHLLFWPAPGKRVHVGDAEIWRGSSSSYPSQAMSSSSFHFSRGSEYAR